MDSWEDGLRRQNKFENIFWEWKEFDSSHKEYIKSTIGLIFFGIEQVDNPPPPVTYYTVYSQERQVIIGNVYELILKRIPSQSIKLSSTFLICKFENDTIEFPVIRCSSLYGNSVRFFDVTARYYENWDDFIGSNKLPPCKFLAPSDGLYRNGSSGYQIFTSPAAANGPITRFFNNVAAVAGIGCLAAGYMALAPVTVTATAVGIGIYGSVQSSNTLRDRYKHGQSIGLDNKESLFCYGNIIASGLTGASTLAVQNITRIRGVCGAYANMATTACKFLNISTLVFDSAFLIINAQDFVQKLHDGNASYRDFFDLSLQIFLVCGAVVQARDMHRMLNQSQSLSSNIVNKKLTRTQKRNLQKRRAKARQRGEVIRSGTDTIPVTEVDVHTSLKAFAVRVGSLGVNVMLSLYPRSEIIIEYFMDMRNLLCRFCEGRIRIEEVCQQLFYHTNNLYTIIRQDLNRMKLILKNFIPSVFISDDDDVAQTLSNEVDRISQVSEDITESVISVVSEEDRPILNVSSTETESHLETIADNVSNDGATSSTSRLKNRKLILDIVKGKCFMYVISGKTDDVLLYFHSVLIFVTNKLVERLLRHYDNIYALNKNKLDEEKLKKCMLVLGRKTVDDFFPSDRLFDKALGEVESEVEEFVSSYLGSNIGSENSPLAATVYDNLVTFIDDLFLKVVGADDVGVEQMVKALQNISARLTEKLSDDVNKMSTDAETLYKENMEILGNNEIVKEMLKAIEIPTEALDIFQTAFRSLDVNDLTAKILETLVHKYEKVVASEAVVLEYDENESDTDAPIIVAEISTKLYEKVVSRNSDTWRKAETYKMVLHFIGVKFIQELEANREALEQFKYNVDFVGPEIYKEMLKAIGILGRQKRTQFYEKAGILSSEDCLNRMVSEFTEYYRTNVINLHNPKIFETIISEDGFTAVKLMCSRNELDEYYRVLADTLFQIEVDISERVTRSKDCIVLKSGSNVVTFNFLKEPNTALVILTDVSKGEI